ncbi:MAG TPA: hypothetical protein VLX09_12275 [Stellaceae bacterium]|nr:hypothetical protein [Stellaceae bacterium]
MKLQSIAACAVVLVTTLWTGAVIAAEGVRVDGMLTYNGATKPLDHVLIVRAGNEEGMEDGPKLRIYLSDGEIPLRFAGGATILGAKSYAQQAGITAVVVRADPAGKDRGGQFSLLNAPGLQPGVAVSTSTTNAFSALQVTEGQASGSTSLSDPPFGLKATFSAPITANPVTSDLTGKAAVDSAQAKAVIGFRDALGKADLATAAKYATAAKMKGIEQARTMMGDQLFRAEVKKEMGGPPLAQTIKRVIVRGDGASVMMGRGSVAELVQEDGGWKVE